MTAPVEPDKASQFSSSSNILNLKIGTVAMLSIDLWFYVRCTIFRDYGERIHHPNNNSESTNTTNSIVIKLRKWCNISSLKYQRIRPLSILIPEGYDAVWKETGIFAIKSTMLKLISKSFLSYNLG